MNLRGGLAALALLASLETSCTINNGKESYTYFSDPRWNNASWVHKKGSLTHEVKKNTSNNILQYSVKVLYEGNYSGKWEIVCSPTSKNFIYSVNSVFYDPSGNQVRKINQFPEELKEIFITHGISDKISKSKKKTN